MLNIVYEERFPVNWFNDFSVNINNNDKYDLLFCSVSSFIEKSTASGLLKLFNLNKVYSYFSNSKFNNYEKTSMKYFLSVNILFYYLCIITLTTTSC